jgi:spermidine/putrescine transport system substrate-binding protein
MKTKWLVALVLAVAACGEKSGTAAAPTAEAPKGERTLHVLVWSDYLVPELTKAFEEEFHCRVAETNFENNEELRAKLLAGNSGFDLVCPSDYTVALLVKDGVLDEIDTARLTNLKNLSPRFDGKPYDPGHRHSVPYQWGVTGIAWRKSALKEAPHSWKDLFDATKSSAWAGKISMLNDGRELAAAALLAQGFSPNTRDEKEIAKAAAALTLQRAGVAKYDSDNFGDALVAKEIDVAQGWTGTIANAQKEDPDIGFVIPDEGALTYVDNWAIPKGAPEKALAMEFMNYLLRADVAAKAANERRYASVNEAAKPMIDPEILKGTAYEDGGGTKKLFWVEDVGPAGDAYKKLFSDLKNQ